ncbi:hypothetical protein AQUCO_00100837v1 [Aquilegia coerulea]|uniref:Uncharacterized protein n=1 Tax=Aquilegia coerulea TaxID=218851 RepID=A0A2G5FCB7_AQUCA|nr:hypothetical protein AQUCO_00100837v1 [Aquilegia coerulea]
MLTCCIFISPNSTNTTTTRHQTPAEDSTSSAMQTFYKFLVDGEWRHYEHQPFVTHWELQTLTSFLQS